MEEDGGVRMDFDSIEPINSEEEGNSNNSNDDGKENFYIYWMNSFIAWMRTFISLDLNIHMMD